MDDHAQPVMTAAQGHVLYAQALDRLDALDEGPATAPGVETLRAVDALLDRIFTEVPHEDMPILLCLVLSLRAAICVDLASLATEPHERARLICEALAFAQEAVERALTGENSGLACHLIPDTLSSLTRAYPVAAATERAMLETRIAAGFEWLDQTLEEMGRQRNEGVGDLFMAETLLLAVPEIENVAERGIVLGQVDALIARARSRFLRIMDAEAIARATEVAARAQDLGPQGSAQWHLHRQGQQYGPYSWEQLRRFAVEGNLQADDLLWHAGLSDWTRAGAVPGLLQPSSGASSMPGQNKP